MRVLDRVEEVVVPAGSIGQPPQGRRNGAVIALRPQTFQSFHLPPFQLRVWLEHLDALDFSLPVAINPDNRAPAGLDGPLLSVRRLFDLRLHVPRLDRGNCPATLLDLLDELPRLPDHGVSQVL